MLIKFSMRCLHARVPDTFSVVNLAELSVFAIILIDGLIDDKDAYDAIKYRRLRKLGVAAAVSPASLDR